MALIIEHWILYEAHVQKMFENYFYNMRNFGSRTNR